MNSTVTHKCTEQTEQHIMRKQNYNNTEFMSFFAINTINSKSLLTVDSEG